MAIKTRTITSYAEIDGIVTNIQNEDKFLVAREEAAEYWSLSWGYIFRNFIDIKANAVPVETIESFGIVKVNEQGVVTEIKELESSDIPQISQDQVYNLIADLASKADKEFAVATNHYVVGYIKASIKETEVTESGHIVHVDPYINIDKTQVSPFHDENHPDIYSNTKIKSKDGSIRYERAENGDILLYVDNAVTNVQADWAQTDETAKDYIKNKPELADVAYTGSYNDLSDKVELENGDETTLELVKDPDSNKYTFTVLSKSEWGKITGDINGQTDLINKFGQYYTAYQIDEILSKISRGVLKIKGYISRFDPTINPDVSLEKGTFWLKSFTTGSPERQEFICYMLISEESGRTRWEEVTYRANDFDVWINLNGTEANSFFWLGVKWEQLDFTLDLTKYYTKTEVDNKLSEKQDKLYGEAGQVLTYGEDLGEIVGTELATVATTGDYEDLINKPVQVQANWSEDDYTQPDYIIDKPILAPVATSGSYNDLTDKPEPVEPQVQADWNEVDATKPSFIKNKPDIKDPERVNITEKFLTFAEYNINDHSYNVAMSEFPDNEFFHEVLWNGVLIRENYEYEIIVDGTYYSTAELEVDTELSSFFISTRRYSTFYPVSERAFQTNWRIKAVVEESGSLDRGSLAIVSEVDTKTISIYENNELVSILSTDDTQPDFYQNMLYTGSLNYTITEVTGSPESNVIGTITTGKLLLLGDSYPEAEDTTDVFTLRFYFKS